MCHAAAQCVTRPGSNYSWIAGRPRCSRNPCDPARGNAAGAGFAVRDGAILLNRVKLFLPVQSPLQKIFACHVGQINSTSFSRLVPTRGAFRDRHGRWNGMRWTRQRRARQWQLQGGSVWISVSDEPARWTNGAEADGKTVWSWHPLLMLSLRRLSRPNRVRTRL